MKAIQVSPANYRPPANVLAALGRKIFFDPSLSASGRLACASCHDPAHAYAPPNALGVQLGGSDMRSAGLRATPSLRYVQKVPPFTEHYYDDDGDDSKDQGPAGGHDWDGRASSVRAQAAGPLLSPQEMGNSDATAVTMKLARATYASEIRTAFGQQVLDDPQRALDAAALALEVFQETPSEFYPYDSKYDFFLRGQERLNQRELHGLQLFNDPKKGNCASCHPSGMAGGGFPQFSDFGFVALGVPRNRTLPANADPAWYDLGLCGPQRTDFTRVKAYCGMFRTPSLRNVATRKSFFHNGVFHSLEEVLRFYAERDVKPDEWFARDDAGKVQVFDDLPAKYRDNVYRDAPFNAKPRLSEPDMRDIIVFLHTLNDGYRRPK